jgi:hypothetical protein
LSCFVHFGYLICLERLCLCDLGFIWFSGLRDLGFVWASVCLQISAAVGFHLFRDLGLI